MTLSRLLAATLVHDDGAHTLEVTPDWVQGRTVFGGLQVALALRAMRALVPPGLPLRTVQAVFVAPVGPRMTARARVLRTGKNAIHVEATLGEAGADCQAIVIAVFAASRTSAIALGPERAPLPEDAPPPRALPYVAGVVPAFVQHFDARWRLGAPPFSGALATHHVIDIALADDDAAASSEAHVVAFADFIPPLGLSPLPPGTPGSTLTWMLELIGPSDGHALAGWRIDAALAWARDGYQSQSLVLYAPDGTAVALGRQSMTIFG